MYSVQPRARVYAVPEIVPATLLAPKSKLLAPVLTVMAAKLRVEFTPPLLGKNRTVPPPVMFSETDVSPIEPAMHLVSLTELSRMIFPPPESERVTAVVPALLIAPPRLSVAPVITEIPAKVEAAPVT